MGLNSNDWYLFSRNSHDNHTSKVPGLCSKSNWKYKAKSAIVRSQKIIFCYHQRVLSVAKVCWVESVARTNSTSPKNLAKKDEMWSSIAEWAEANFKGQEVVQHEDKTRNSFQDNRNSGTGDELGMWADVGSSELRLWK